MDKITITARNENFEGIRNRVPFSKGKALVPVDYDDLAWFNENGYMIGLPSSGIYNETIPFDGDDDLMDDAKFLADKYIKEYLNATEVDEEDLEEDEPEEDLNDLTIAQLRAMAKDREIDLGTARRKADIIELMS